MSAGQDSGAGKRRTTAARGDSAKASEAEQASGHVYLVGAGPGDPGLLTARALELIGQADVLIYDRLIPASALSGARPDAEMIFAGKQGGGPSTSQEEIERMIIERASAGATVVRLKGGDPFVFGRGGEEALALRAANVSFDVIPGVTAAVAASASAGIPVTHRGIAGAVAFATGATRSGGAARSRSEWLALAQFPGTLVFYMGLANLPQIAGSLLDAGMPASRPAAVIERGTLPGQRQVTATVSTISQRVEDHGIKAPAIVVIGEVVTLAESLARDLPDAPLAGLSVAVTRARAQASSLAHRLEALGAEVIQAPTIRIEPLDGPPIDPTPYDLVCLTSANGVNILFERLAASGRDARSLAGAKIAAIGPGTASALAAHGITADIVPDRFVAEGLVESLAHVPVTRALIARAADARETLPSALESRGAQVDVVPLYETVAEPLSDGVLQAARRASYITFTSSSTVRFFAASASASAPGPASSRRSVSHDATPPRRGRPAAPLISPQTRVVSIGPVTSAALRQHGIEVDVQAERHDIDGLLEALIADALS